MDGELPGGLTVKVSCCAAESYANDDAIAVDYSSICNGATSNTRRYDSLFFASIVSVIVMILFSI